MGTPGPGKMGTPLGKWGPPHHFRIRFMLHQILTALCRMVVICISASMSAKALVHVEHGWNIATSRNLHLVSVPDYSRTAEYSAVRE